MKRKLSYIIDDLMSIANNNKLDASITALLIEAANNLRQLDSKNSELESKDIELQKYRDLVTSNNLQINFK